MDRKSDFNKLLEVITEHIRQLEGYFYFLNNFLFRENPDNNRKQTELMCNTFPSFFGYTQYSFWETFILILCRLNDEDVMEIRDRHTGKIIEERKHCSFKMLMKEIKKIEKLKQNPKVQKDLQKKLQNFEGSMKSGKLYRNRLIAHSDLKTYCECIKNGIITDDTDDKLKNSQKDNLNSFLKAKDFFASVYEFFENEKFTIYNHDLDIEIKNLISLLEKYKYDNTTKKHS